MGYGRRSVWTLIGGNQIRATHALSASIIGLFSFGSVNPMRRRNRLNQHKMTHHRWFNIFSERASRILIVKIISVTSSLIIIGGRKFFFHCLPHWKYLNSPGTKIFPFSYFAFTSLKLKKVIKDIKNINIFHKTRVHGLDFGRESFYRNHHMTPC